MMEAGAVGRVGSLHRFPVKSMAGEDLTTAAIGGTGLRGDRVYALIDRETGHVISAKRPRRWPGLLDYHARLGEHPDGAPDLPPVVITCPDGTSMSRVPGPELDALLSARLGRSVSLTSTPPEGASFEYHWPDQPNLLYQGRLYRDELTEHVMPPGTFFDSGILHLVTSATLMELRSRVPGSRFEPRRFRPNIVIETAASGFVENDWVGRVVRIGDAVRIRIVKPCIRCVMVNLDQAGLGPDPAVLAAAFEHNGGNVGVKGDVLSVGRVRVGDPVAID
ncbi:MAG: MOSC N-terminal beta barrel domain-containing protein [Gemmatimonadota bacterium]